jgi:hypothetical protein
MAHGGELTRRAYVILQIGEQQETALFCGNTLDFFGIPSRPAGDDDIPARVRQAILIVDERDLPIDTERFEMSACSVRLPALTVHHLDDM